MMWLLLAGAILLEVFATLALRASDGLRRRRWIGPIVTSYVMSFYLLWLALSQGVPVGIAYGIWTASGVAVVALMARVLFDDPLTPVMMLGIVLIASGVFTIELVGVTG